MKPAILRYKQDGEGRRSRASGRYSVRSARCFGYVQVIQAYKQGNYKNVEGYVENFVPASSGGEDQEDMEEESFDIKGVHFSYGDKFIKKFGYHRPSTQGGYIKKDGQYLKIGYISTEKGYVIVKIQERK